MAVLLIGSTGSGKSTLGNFLFDPSPMPFQNFEVATNNLPKTQECKKITRNVTFQSSHDEFCDVTDEKSHYIAYDTSRENPRHTSGGTIHGTHQDTGVVRSFKKFTKAIGIGGDEDTERYVERSEKLTIIDTPGHIINESSFKHMTDLVTTLKDQESFRACIIVVDFKAKVDQQYKGIIKYYSTLLPSLFGENKCFIVMTHYATDRRSEDIRKMQNYEHDTVKKNFTKEIGGTPYIFSIDSVPYEDGEVKQSKKFRDAILSHIFSLQEVNVTEFRVAKTSIMQSEDKEEIKSHEEKIKSYKERIQEANKKAEEARLESNTKEEVIATFEADRSRQEESLRDIDTNEFVTAHVWPFDKPWNFFKWQKKDFDETSEFEVFNVTKWTNEHCWFKEFTREGNRVYGVLEGAFMCGLEARITVETKKRIFHEKDIKNIKAKIQLLEYKLHEAKVTQEECRKKHDEFKSKAVNLQKKIKEEEELIECLSLDTMTLEQAKARLQKERRCEF